MISSISNFILRHLGWTIEKKLPNEKKYLVIGAHHTSNWDLPVALLCLSTMKLRCNWIGKHTLFIWPLGIIFRALGGKPVNRSKHTGFIQKVSDLYNSSDEMIIVMSPEGTRSKTNHWKTGFYYIALKAQLPVALAYIDYPNKQVGIGKSFMPSGDIQKDLEIIRDFYRTKTGKHPHKQSNIEIKNRD